MQAVTQVLLREIITLKTCFVKFLLIKRQGFHLTILSQKIMGLKTKQSIS